MLPRASTLVVLAALGAVGCDARTLVMSVDGPAPPRAVHVGDTLRMKAMLTESSGAVPRVVSNLPDCAWRAKPAGAAVFTPGADRNDPWVTVRFLKEGDATLWVTWECLEPEDDLTVLVKPPGAP